MPKLKVGVTPENPPPVPEPRPEKLNSGFFSGDEPAAPSPFSLAASPSFLASSFSPPSVSASSFFSPSFFSASPSFLSPAAHTRFEGRGEGGCVNNHRQRFDSNQVCILRRRGKEGERVLRGGKGVWMAGGYDQTVGTSTLGQTSNLWKCCSCVPPGEFFRHIKPAGAPQEKPPALAPAPGALATAAAGSETPSGTAAPPRLAFTILRFAISSGAAFLNSPSCAQQSVSARAAAVDVWHEAGQLRSLNWDLGGVAEHGVLLANPEEGGGEGISAFPPRVLEQRTPLRRSSVRKCVCADSYNATSSHRACIAAGCGRRPAHVAVAWPGRECHRDFLGPRGRARHPFPGSMHRPRMWETRCGQNIGGTVITSSPLPSSPPSSLSQLS